MNGNVRRIFEEIKIPPSLAESVAGSVEQKRSVDMDKTRKISGKKIAVILAAVIGIAALCAMGWPKLREDIWGRSAVVQENDDGKAVAILQSVFDPASYRPQKMTNRIYMPKTVLGDPEAEIMTVFEEHTKIEDCEFEFFDNGEKIEDIGAYRPDIGGSIKAVCPWSEFTLTRESENKFVMVDEENCGFNYYIYPMTGDVHIDLDFTPTGIISTPKDITAVENGTGGFTVEPGTAAAIGNDTVKYKKGDRVKFTVKFRNVGDVDPETTAFLGYYLDPSDPAGESDGIAYREGDGWFYPIDVPLREGETVVEFPLKLSGDYKFCIANPYGEQAFEVEMFGVEAGDME